MYVYIYIYMCIHIHIYVCVYKYVNRGRTCASRRPHSRLLSQWAGTALEQRNNNLEGLTLKATTIICILHATNGGRKIQHGIID